MQTEKRKVHRGLRPAVILALSFAAVIIAGALLLTLPVSGRDGESVGFLPALFTATSGTCVTGLIVAPTGLTFSTFGQVILLSLIQLGGLGTMTAALVIYTVIGKRLSLRDKLRLSESINEESIASTTMQMAKRALAITFAIESAGALLLMAWLIPRFGMQGIWYSIFLSISAFCNSGMDIFLHGDSLMPYNTEPYLLMVLGLLVVLGGLGSIVISDIIGLPNGKRKQRFSLHSKMVLITTLVLLVLGTVLFYFFEGQNDATMGNMSVSNRWANSLFQSITPRTAGFAAVAQGKLTNASFLLSMVLMFIGASPASTGGGIKTTTFVVLLMTLFAVMSGRKDVQFRERRLSWELVRRAMAIAMVFLFLLMVGIIAIAAIESGGPGDRTLMDIAYDVVSALCTVGLSTGITPSLSAASQLILIMLMYFGRVGPMTILLALVKEHTANASIRMPEERVMIG